MCAVLPLELQNVLYVQPNYSFNEGLVLIDARSRANGLSESLLTQLKNLILHKPSQKNLVQLVSGQ